MSNTITLPGLIDCHVHFREPGFPEKATMHSEAVSARAGGMLTVCEMPNTDPPCVTVDTLKQKIAIAGSITDCDIRFFFGITEAAHIKELRTAWNDPKLRARLCGVKLYLDHSTGNQKVEGGIVEDIFAVCTELGITLVAHCEDSAINDEAAKFIRNSGDADGIENDVSLHSLMRPSASEATSIAYAIDLARKHSTQFHIAHLSTAQGIELVRTAKQNGIAVTCEVAPHHLFLTIDDYKTLGTLAKMNPPLRTKTDQQALWDGIADGTIDCIATDHAPHTLAEKQVMPPLSAPSGVPGVETMLPLLLTVASGNWPHPTSAPPKNISTFKHLPAGRQVSNIRTLCYENPNRIFQLNASDKDRLTVNCNAKWVIHAAQLHSKCTWTPFEGWHVQGKVVR